MTTAETTVLPDSPLQPFRPPLTTLRRPNVEALFAAPARLLVQGLAESHEYKKVSGSSDGAMTYDTTAT